MVYFDFFFIFRRKNWRKRRIVRPCPSQRTTRVIVALLSRSTAYVRCCCNFARTFLKTEISKCSLNIICIATLHLRVKRVFRIYVGFFAAPLVGIFSTSQQVEEIFPSRKWIFFNVVILFNGRICAVLATTGFFDRYFSRRFHGKFVISAFFYIRP